MCYCMLASKPKVYTKGKEKICFLILLICMQIRFFYFQEVFIMELEKRIGVVGIVIEDLEQVPIINDILHQYGNIIVGRLGLPYREKGISIISLVVDGTTDEIGALNGKLGKISGVNVKSALSKKVF